LAVPVDAWLEAQGFTSNPFAVWEADSEPKLSNHFIHMSWFDQICGDPRNPRSAILFAKRGYGKTACRREVARLCGPQHRPPALIVQIIAYEWILSEGLQSITLQRYLTYIVRQAMQEIWSKLQRRKSRRSALLDNEQLALDFYALMRWAGTREAALLPVRDFSDDQLSRLVDYYRNQAEPMDILQKLVELAQAAGYVSVYVLVDRVDELPLTENDMDAALDLLRPLLGSLSILGSPGIAFKFFLPEELHDLMTQLGIGRLDRIHHHHLYWTNDTLLQLLSERLRSYSPMVDLGDAPGVIAFQDLCEQSNDGDIDKQLVETCEGSPRRLIILANQIVLDHCQTADTVESQISVDILNSHLRRIPKISLNLRGEILFDGVDQQIKLPKLLHKLLQLLWQERNRYVTEVEIHDHIYMSDNEGKIRDPQKQEESTQNPRSADAVYKLVTRLRRKIEPELKNSKNYIDFVHGHGYRLCNFENDAPS
jgi:DNA-binding winged helix-turn-helix (wHTH) protein